MTEPRNFHIDTTGLASKHSEALWYELIAPITSADRLDGQILGGRLNAWLTGEQMLTQVQSRPQRTTRSRAHTAVHPLDFYNVLILQEGHKTFQTERQSVQLGPGDAIIEDMARPQNIVSTASLGLNLMVPRHSLEALLPNRDLHGLHLPASAGPTRLFCTHVTRLFQRMEHLSPSQLAAAQNASLALLAAASLRGGERLPEAARGYVQQAVREELQHHIEQHLSDPHLSTDTLCARYRMSRTQIYRLFAECGGVSAYIRDRRLVRVAERILASNQRPNSDLLAQESGFGSANTLQRAFRSRYGVSVSALWRAKEGERPSDVDPAMPRAVYDRAVSLIERLHNADAHQ